MRVPSKKGQSVRPSGEVSNFVSDRGATPEAFGAQVERATQRLGDAFVSLGAAAEKEHKDSERFTAMRGLSELQLEAAKHGIDMKSTHNPATSNYYVRAEEDWNTLEEKYLSTVPENLREEMRYRATQAKRGVLVDAYTFEYTEKDRYYRKELATALEGAHATLEQSPTRETLEQTIGAWDEQVDSSNLSPVDKETVKKQGRVALVTQHYKIMQKAKAASGTSGVTGMDLLRQQESIRLKPYQDISAKTGKPAGLRIGFGSDTITFPDGTYRKVRSDDVITREQAELDLQRRWKTEFEPTARNKIGHAAWEKLPAELRGIAVGLAYQGAIARGYVGEAFASGSRQKMAEAMDRLAQDFPVTKKRYMEYKAIILGEKNIGVDVIHNDPIYKDIPYEDRLALARDAQIEVSKIETARAKQQKEQYESWLSGVLNKYADGTEGQLEHERRIENGEYKDFDDRKKADETLKKYQEDALLAKRAAEKRDDPTALWTDSKDDKKMRDALHKDAPQRLAEFDEAYVTNSLVPDTRRTNGIPGPASYALAGMIQRNDPRSMLFAMETLRQIQEQAPSVFNADVDENTQKQYDRYKTMKTFLPEDVMLSRLMGGLTPEDKNNRITLRQEAQDIIKSEEYVKDFEDNFGSWFSSPDLPYVADRKPQIQKDYTTLFQENYAVIGDQEKAHEVTLEQIKRVWGVSQLSSDGSYLMKYPPDKFIPEGRIIFAQDDLKQQIPLKDGEKYQLISDEQTAAEAKAYQSVRPDQDRVFPSYRVAVIRENGELEFLPPHQRWTFEMSDFHKSVEQEGLKKDIAAEDYRRAVYDLERAQGLHDAPMASEEVQRELADKVRMLYKVYNEQDAVTAETVEEADTPEQRVKEYKAAIRDAEIRLHQARGFIRDKAIIKQLEDEVTMWKKLYEGELNATSE